MTTQEVNEQIEKLCKDFIDVCPHCNTKAHLELIHNDYFMARNGDQFNHITFRCKPCKKISVKVFKSTENPYSDEQMLSPDRWVSEFPSINSVPPENFIEFSPKDVIEDYSEGLACLSNGADKAAVSMFRRAIQNAMLNLGADTNKDLVNQIKDVNSLTNDIKNWAQNIRIFGNWGAHPQDDHLKAVNHELALEAKDFVDQFINYVYVMPGRVAAVRKLHRNTKSEAGKEGAA